MAGQDADETGFEVARFCARFLAGGHNGLMGLRYLDHSPGHIQLELPYSEDLADEARGGAMADGAIITLLDMAGTIAVWSRIDRFRPHATIDLRIDHLVVPPRSPITCAVDCFLVDAALARVRGAAHAGDQAIATFAATYAFTGP